MVLILLMPISIVEKYIAVKKIGTMLYQDMKMSLRMRQTNMRNGQSWLPLVLISLS